MKRSYGLFRLTGAAVAVAALLAAGCEEDVNPLSGTDLAYTMYGLLAPTMDTQWVRVFPVEGTLRPRRDGSLDAVVTSTDLETGEVRTWRDSALATNNGQVEHAYWSVFPAEFGRQYRLQVTRSDGAFTYAELEVPVRTEVETLTDEVTTVPRVLLPVRINGRVPRLVNISIEYDVRFSVNESARYTWVYDDAAEAAENGTLVRVDLTTARVRVHEQLYRENRLSACGAVLLAAKIRYLVTTSEWEPPGGRFDPVVLSMPGIMDNVEQGFGFVASGYWTEGALIIPEATAQKAGFRTPQEFGACTVNNGG